MKSAKPAGVILAGGRSSRMGVTRKALLELHGQTLLERVIDRFQSHTEPLLISCESDTGDFDDYGLTVVPDLLPGFHGPLIGLYSALQLLIDRGQNTGLVLFPCDAPFVPHKLVQTLLDTVQDDHESVAVISYEGVLQPTFSLWQTHHLPVIRDAVLDEGMGGLKYVLTSLPYKVVEWASSVPPPFFNVNTPEEMQTAALWLDRLQG
jgi:molybdopterin-guanine dinucleotide biosynthesis protein A